MVRQQAAGAMMDWTVWALVWFYVAGLVPAFITAGIMLHPTADYLFPYAMISATLLWPLAAVVFTLLFLGDIIVECLTESWDEFMDMLHAARS